MNENTWKQSARAWWERLNEERASLARERLKNAELLRKIEELRAAIPRVIDCDGMTFEQVRELLRKREAAQPSGIPGDFAGDDRNKIKIYEHEINEWDALCGNALRDYANETGCIVAGDHLGAAVAAALREVYQLRKDVAKWRELWEMERDAGNTEHKRLEAKLSAVGNLADLAERIAFADGKKPRDLEDGGWGSIRDALQALVCARNTLAENHTWSSALRCEVEEAMYSLACGDMDGFADELLDVATVAVRCRRAVMEKKKK